MNTLSKIPGRGGLRLVGPLALACSVLAGCSGDGSSSTSASTASGSGGDSATSASTTGAGGNAASTTSGSGTTGAATTGSSSGSTSAGTGGMPMNCSALPLCDDFEAATAGGPPSPSTWAIVSPSCSGTGTIAVDDTVAHSGTRSVKVTGKGGYCNHVFFVNTTAPAAVGKDIYGRYYLRLGGALGDAHNTLMTMKDTADNGKDLRLGGQKSVMIWNRESDDATLPELSPTGAGLSVSPTPQAWHCVEFLVKGSDGQMQTWLDSVEVAGLHEDGVPTPDIDGQWLNKANWKPSLADLKLGWESYGNDDMTLWFDDVALGPARIGCN